MPPNNLRAFGSNDSNDDEGSIHTKPSSSGEEELSNDGSNSLCEKEVSMQCQKSTNDSEDDVSETWNDSFPASSDSDSSRFPPHPSQNNGTSKTVTLAATVSAAAALYACEKHRQRKLTRIPRVLGQIPLGSEMEAIHQRLIAGDPKSSLDGILSRSVVPSLFVGTHGQLASTAAYLAPGPSSNDRSVLRFSETLVASHDGAELHLDWEIPNAEDHGILRKQAILSGSISNPTVIILHGINNSSKYGYIRSLQRAMTQRGWNAVGLNFRGCGPSKLSTPRSYTASYTGDLRSVVRQLAARCASPSGKDGTLFLVGNSLGAQLVTKFLGEEGLAGSLPGCVWGGISLGNPFRFFSNHIKFPFGGVIGGARKMNYLQQRQAMPLTQRDVLHPSKITLQSLDRVLAPTMVRNSPHPPYETRIGYGHQSHSHPESAPHSDAASSSSARTAVDAYWKDSKCYEQGGHVTVPLLHVVARDDNLCFNSSRMVLGSSLRNPNVLVVQTRTGGHLGWWHKPSNSSSKSKASWLGLDSWADEATADFIQAILDTRQDRGHSAATSAAATIDDARNLYRVNARNNTDDDNSNTIGASMRARNGGSNDDSSTIATDDSHFHRNMRGGRVETLSARKHAYQPQATTYFQFRRVLLLGQEQEEGETHRILAQHRLREAQRATELGFRHRSRL